MSDVTVCVNYGSKNLSFSCSPETTFAALAKKIISSIESLSIEQGKLYWYHDGGRYFIHSFQLYAKGENVYPVKQDQKLKSYVENDEVHVAASWHHHGRSYDPDSAVAQGEPIPQTSTTIKLLDEKDEEEKSSADSTQDNTG